MEPKLIVHFMGKKSRLTHYQLLPIYPFVTTVTLEKGVPIDSVSKMLGHRSIKSTQIYAQVTDRKISDDTNELFKKLLQ